MNKEQQLGNHMVTTNGQTKENPWHPATCSLKGLAICRTLNVAPGPGIKMYQTRRSKWGTENSAPRHSPGKLIRAIGQSLKCAKTCNSIARCCFGQLPKFQRSIQYAPMQSNTWSELDGFGDCHGLSCGILLLRMLLPKQQSTKCGSALSDTCGVELMEQRFLHASCFDALDALVLGNHSAGPICVICPILLLCLRQSSVQLLAS